MSTDQTILPDFVIANLFGNNLVVGNDVVAKGRPKPNPVENSVASMAAMQVATIPAEKANPIIVTPIPSKPVDAVPIVTTNPIVPKTINVKATPSNTASEPPKQWFLGNNGKQITVMVKEDAVPYINDKHLQFLSNVLSACKLNLGDIALVNYKNYPLGFEELRSKSNPKIVLVFDLSPKELKLPFTIPFYQVQDYAQCRFLFAPSLTKMEGDHADAKAEKTKLWNSLKILFGL